ncbi:PREDICTED: uncharacterized protein LOC109191032 [Ipomoea nil]|uniref:uncharacterized protein LOC109191032 n=1 Tax=Ipomoea nil TaxID=35883 RepID=UPI000901E81D|nr:PREDICTED: uncharacterized protein LOC109191032 [Ipomoea nil]
MDWNELDLPLTLEEIKRNLFEMAPCKAPEPDGYSASFYQKAWRIVGESLLVCVKLFFEIGILPADCNDTLLSLIPKVPNPNCVKQFRPISLCNVSNKLITKIMSSRLKSISRKLIDPHQTSFVPGRQISDNILIYQEVLNSMKNKKGKGGWMTMKIDLEKAYDRLSWDFIKDTVEDIDDLVFFGEATEQQALEMKRCLDTFCTCSGQKLSFQKSTLFFSKNTEDGLQQRIAAVAGIPIVSNMGIYLGIPSIHGKIKSETFAGVISAIEKLIISFLWGSKDGERRCHLVKWDVVTKSKAYGGLDIRKLEQMNLAFFAKLGWRLMQNEESLWSRVFNAKYAITGADCSNWRQRRVKTLSSTKELGSKSEVAEIHLFGTIDGSMIVH